MILCELDQRVPSRPPPRTKWTRRVPHPVLIGHAASLEQVDESPVLIDTGLRTLDGPQLHKLPLQAPPTPLRV